MAAGDPDEKRGGYRPRAGRKKGAKNYRTRLKEQIAEELALKKQITEDVRMLLPLGLRKKGLKALENITIQEIEEDYKRRIGHSAHKLLNAQMSLALGTQCLYKIHLEVDSRGKEVRKHILVTDPDEIREYLDDPLKTDGVDYYYITTKNPDNNAINSVLDRLFGKASTKIVGAANPDGSEGPIKVIVANFNAGNQLPSPATQPIIESVVADVLQEEESITDQAPNDSSLSDSNSPEEFNDGNMTYSTHNYGS